MVIFNHCTVYNSVLHLQMYIKYTVIYKKYKKWYRHQELYDYNLDIYTKI